MNSIVHICLLILTQWLCTLLTCIINATLRSPPFAPSCLPSHISILWAVTATQPEVFSSNSYSSAMKNTMPLQEPGSPSLNPFFRNLSSLSKHTHTNPIPSLCILLFSHWCIMPCYDVARSAVIRTIHTIWSQIKSGYLRAIWRFSFKVSSTASAHHLLCMSQRLTTSFVQ